ncbi:MAG: 3-phosphoshikimate 1-carboxyvinyltransferase [Clostridia bacterium]|jgi:3-phosphoshikimate 1-carboxyvinyltransferase
MLVEQRSSLRGEIVVPGDKSISQRAIMFGSIAKGNTEIDGLLLGEDCLYTIECFRKMQIGIDILPNNRVIVCGKGLNGLSQPASTLNTGKSGTTIRLLLGILAGQPFTSTLVREETLQRRPVGNFIKPLLQMGANITGKEDGNYCPLTVSPSRLHGITFELSPYDMYIKSPLLLAGLYADGETKVIESVKSRDHSELMLNSFGADIRVDGLNVTSRRVEELYSQHITIPGDISIAAYFITAGLLVPNSDITIRNVGINPTRTGILDIYKKMGAKIEITNERVVSNERVADIRAKSSSLKAVTIDRTVIPSLLDEIPIIAVAATYAKGTTTIEGLSGYKIKETNRIKSLVAELLKMGAKVRETEDGMVIEGGKSLKGTIIETYGDYSIAMSMSIAGLIAEGETMIRKSQILDLAYPEFQTVLNKL